MRMRTAGVAIALLAGLGMHSPVCEAADEWGGSLGIASDYFVRGISRTNDQSALQLDLHYSNAAGFLAGILASNAQVDPGRPRDVELSGFIGFAWNVKEDWRGTLLLSHYAYAGNRAGSQYNYDEIDLGIAYQGWLHLSIDYSPNAPRYLAYGNGSLIAVAEKSAEMSLQRPIIGKLSATAGIGYAFLDGPDSGGYAYWSVGGAYDLKSLSLVLSYIDTTAEAKALFYNAAATGRWVGTVLWRF